MRRYAMVSLVFGLALACAASSLATDSRLEVKLTSGEFIASWVLDGRAVQDIFTIHPSEPCKTWRLEAELHMKHRDAARSVKW